MKKCTSFQTWKTLVGKSFEAFSKIWWRMAIVNILTVAIIVGITFLIFNGVVFWGFESMQSFENFLANQKFGGEVNMNKMLILLLAFILVILAAIFVGTVGKITNWTIIKNLTKKKNKNPFKSFFVDSWQFFWRYLWLGLKIAFYILWPIVLGIVAIVFLGIFTGKLEIVVLILGLPLAVFTIFRAFRIVFAPAFLIATKKSATEAMKTSMKMIKGNWLFTFTSIVSLGILVSIPLFVFDFSDYLMSFGWDFSIENFKDVISDDPKIYSPSVFVLLKTFILIFVVAPLMTGFMYFLMLNVASNKKIKT